MIDAEYAPSARPVPPKKEGVAHMLAATGYSLAGFRRLLGETAFRQELAFLGAVFVAFAAFGVGALAWVVALMLFALLAATEALNTAIEEVVDRVSPERSEFARHAKDLGSFAVFCLLAANLLHAGYALYAA